MPCGWIKRNRGLIMTLGIVFLCLVLGWLGGQQVLKEFIDEIWITAFLNNIGTWQNEYPDNPCFVWSRELLFKPIIWLPAFFLGLALAAKHSSKRIFDTSACILLLIFSFYFCFSSGQRGFFAFDQSIVFDGSYRILSGQIPYKDFVIPFGPMVFWTQALFFKLLGASYASYIFGAAFINTLVTAISIILLRILFPAYRILSYLAGLLTAVWFYAPFGTPWMEQTAFFFSLLAFIALLFSLQLQNRHPIIYSLLLFVSGQLAVLALLSKQNAGVFIFPLYFFVMIAFDAPDFKRVGRNAGIFLAGVMGGMAIFWGWLSLYSHPDIFVQYAVKRPASIGKVRLFKDGLLPVFKTLIFGWAPRRWKLFNWGFMVISMIVSSLYIFNFKTNRELWRRRLLACIVCLCLIMAQNIFIQSTYNQCTNGFVFMGVIFATGIGLLLFLKKWGASSIKDKTSRAIITAILVLGISLSATVSYIVFIDGINISLSRDVQDIFRESSFPKPCQIGGLRGLRWGVPTPVGNSHVSLKDIDNLQKYLKRRGRPFFIFPDFTIFYALLNVASPQPILWFDKGLTYPERYDRSLDEWIVRDLKKNNVALVILEQESLKGTDERLNHFPILKSYIHTNFKKEHQIGIFDIFEKRIKQFSKN